MVPFQFKDSKYHLPPFPTPSLLLECDSTQWPPQESLLGSWKNKQLIYEHYKPSSIQNDHDFVLYNDSNFDLQFLDLNIDRAQKTR